MNPTLTRLGLGLLLGSASLGCSSSETPAGPAAATPGNPDGGTAAPGTSPTAAPGTVSTTPGTCASPVIEIAFAPMFSAFDGVHTFQVPAIVDGIMGAAVVWSSSDPTMVDLQPDAKTGGVLITVQKAGAVDIIASAGNLCGSSKLTITAGTPEEWEAGNQRYNNGIVLQPGRPPGAGGGGPRADGGGGGDGGPSREVACTNCHGPTANGPFKTVAHTPQQAGGFSDSDLTSIVTKGVIPEGGYFDPTIVPYEQWQRFHRWDMTPEAMRGMLLYLRSLTPAPQTGSSNFGGRGDGGVRRDGGFGRGDGGGGRREAGGDPADAGAVGP